MARDGTHVRVACDQCTCECATACAHVFQVYASETNKKAHLSVECLL